MIWLAGHLQTAAMALHAQDIVPKYFSIHRIYAHELTILKAISKKKT
jgi:hypothetical protein